MMHFIYNLIHRYVLYGTYKPYNDISNLDGGVANPPVSVHGIAAELGLTAVVRLESVVLNCHSAW